MHSFRRELGNNNPSLSSICLFIYHSIIYNLSLCLSIDLSVYLSIYLHLYLFTYPSSSRCHLSTIHRFINLLHFIYLYLLSITSSLFFLKIRFALYSETKTVCEPSQSSNIFTMIHLHLCIFFLVLSLHSCLHALTPTQNASNMLVSCFKFGASEAFFQ